jgi:hypothetical protein
MKKALIGMMILVLAVLNACSSSSETAVDSAESADGTPPADIVIGGKPFTEQLILVEIMAQLLNAKTDHHISTKEGLGISNVLLQALKDDEMKKRNMLEKSTQLSRLFCCSYRCATTLSFKISIMVDSFYVIIWILQRLGLGGHYVLAHTGQEENSSNKAEG